MGRTDAFTLDCYSCNISILNMTAESLAPCLSQTVTCSGRDAKCYINYNRQGLQFNITAGCVNGTQDKQYDDYCKAKAATRKCPLPNSRNIVKTALDTLGDIDCAYCCAKNTPCNAFIDGRLTGIERVTKLTDKGYSQPEVNAKALGRVLAYARDDRNSGAKRFIADS